MPRTSITPEEIITALQKTARELFLQNGIAATEMKTIAAQSGLSRSTLYRHAFDKNQLAFLVVEQEMRTMLEDCITFEPDSQLTGYEKLRCYCGMQLDIFENSVPVLRLINEFDSIYVGAYPDIAEARSYVVTIQRLLNRTVQLILNGMADGSIQHIANPSLYAATLENTLFGLSLRFFPREAHYAEEQHFAGRQVIEMAVNAILEKYKA